MKTRNHSSDFEFTFQCKKQWHQLQATVDPDVKFCNECNLKVHAITNLLDLNKLEIGQKCVAAINTSPDRIIIGGITGSLPSQHIY